MNTAKRYQKIGCKSTRLTPEIIALLKQGLSKKKISKRLGISVEPIIKIAKANGLYNDEKALRKKTKRNDKIKSLIVQGFTYLFIAKRFNITKQRVYQIACEYSISSRTEKAKKERQMMQLIKQELKKGTASKDILKKYRHSISKNNMRLISNKKVNEIKNRNKSIISKFRKGQTAREIAQAHRLLSTNSVYHICTKQGVFKYPKIRNRSAGEISEKAKIFQLIARLKENENFSFQEITDFLNKKRYKTISDKKFTSPNTRAKYILYKQRLEGQRHNKHA